MPSHKHAPQLRLDFTSMKLLMHFVMNDVLFPRSCIYGFLKVDEY